MKVLTLVMSALLAPGALQAQELRWPDFRAIKTDLPRLAPAQPLPPEGCPGLTALGQSESYPDSPPAVREVSEIGPDALPLPKDGLDRAGILTALKTNLDYWNSKPSSYKVSIAGVSYDAERMRRTTAALLEIFSARMPADEILNALRARFRIYRASADDGTGKTVITGYYEAEIPVTREPDPAHKYPVMLRPADLVRATPEMNVDFDYGRYDETGRLVRYYSTAEIHGGALTGRGLELVWSAHPAKIMLLQIQGSGILRFPDGDFIRVGMAGANGHPFRSAQRILMDCGEIPAMSFKNFIAYLTALPTSREELITDLNPRYIFFTPKPKDSLPYGAMGRTLTPGRSIAVDPKYIPLGFSGLLKSRRPVAAGDELSFADFTRFVFSQDTGSAIRGPGRVDLFWGSGSAAETEASSMKAPGELYLFVIK